MAKAKSGRFSRQYEFFGLQAKYVRDLTSAPVGSSGPALFSSAIELFRCSSVMGCLYGKTAAPCPISNTEKSTTIFADAFTSRGDKRRFLLRLIILNAEKEIPVVTDRLDRVFRHDVDTDENCALFETYRLGGLEYLHSYFFDQQSGLDSVERRKGLIRNLLQQESVSKKDIDEDDYIEEISTDPLI